MNFVISMFAALGIMALGFVLVLWGVYVGTLQLCKEAEDGKILRVNGKRVRLHLEVLDNKEDSP